MAKLTRKPQWHEHLKIYLDGCTDVAFKWGSHDCLKFCAGAIKAMTGVDLMEGIEGTYSNEEEALQFLRDHGYKTLRGAVTKKLGKPVHAALAGKGDIVFIADKNGKRCGVCAGYYSWFVGEYPVAVRADGSPVMQQGLVSVPTLTCQLAWKVG